MSERLQVHFTPAEGALVRMLGLVERRGYAVTGLAMAERPDGGALTLDLEARGHGRPLEVVARQLDRLIDVTSVSVVTPNQGPQA